MTISAALDAEKGSDLLREISIVGLIYYQRIDVVEEQRLFFRRIDPTKHQVLCF